MKACKVFELKTDIISWRVSAYLKFHAGKSFYLGRKRLSTNVLNQFWLFFFCILHHDVPNLLTRWHTGTAGRPLWHQHWSVQNAKCKWCSFDLHLLAQLWNLFTVYGWWFSFYVVITTAESFPFVTQCCLMTWEPQPFSTGVIIFSFTERFLLFRWWNDGILCNSTLGNISLAKLFLIQSDV